MTWLCVNLAVGHLHLAQALTWSVPETITAKTKKNPFQTDLFPAQSPWKHFGTQELSILMLCHLHASYYTAAASAALPVALLQAWIVHSRKVNFALVKTDFLCQNAATHLGCLSWEQCLSRNNADVSYCPLLQAERPRYRQQIRILPQDVQCKSSLRISDYSDRSSPPRVNLVHVCKTCVFETMVGKEIILMQRIVNNSHGSLRFLSMSSYNYFVMV